MVTRKIEEIARKYFTGDFNFELLETGHINQTFLANNKSGLKFILQSLNSHIFKEPKSVIDNYVNIQPFCRDIIPELIQTTDGQLFHTIGNNVWRAFEYVENTRTILEIQNEDQAYYGAKLFGIFLYKCRVVNPGDIAETIPEFHNLSTRITKFQTAYKSDKFNRGDSIRKLIPVLDKFYFLGREFEKALEYLPLRVVHNDTKPGNILFDRETNMARKVIDLDTVMPGLLITDFGDMVRSFTPGGKEDDPDPGSSEVRKNIFNALTEGFSESIHGFILQEEKELLTFGAKCIILEQALRFLTDFLEGDLYYKTNRENQNLDRGIHQLNILQSV